MGPSPSPALLRLREADIVRLCGLAAAGDGLRLAAHHLLRYPQRRGGRLAAMLQDTSGETWAEVVEAEAHLTLRWGCGCPAGLQAAGGADGQLRDSLSGGALACVHVAALLSAWLRDPAVFALAEREPAAADAKPGQEGHAGTPGVRPTATTQAPEPAARARAHPTALRAALEALPPPQRATLADRVLGPTAAVPAEGVLDALAAALADPERVGQMLAALDAPALALLRAMQLRGGSLTAADLDGLAARHRGAPGAVASARQQLEARGLLFRAPDPAPAPRSGSAGHGTPGNAAAIWFIPHGTARAAGVDLPLRPMPTVAPNGPPRFASEDGRAPASSPRGWVHPAPLRQLCAAVALLAHAAPWLVTAGRREPTRRVRPRGPHGTRLPAAPGDPPRAALATAARATHLPAGLLRLAWRLNAAAGDGPAAAPSLATLARLPAAEWAAALRGAFRAWLERATYAELSDLTLAEEGTEVRCDPAHPTLRWSALADEQTRARRFIVELVGRLRTDGWYALDDLLDLVWWVHPYFLRERQRVFSEPAWWLAGDGGSRPLDARMADEWRRAEGRYITALLAGPLHWWGVLDLAGIEGAAARAVRLTALGAYLLGHASSPPGTVAALASDWGPAALPTRDAVRAASATASHDAGLAIQPLAAPPTQLDALGQWAHVTGLAGDRLLWQFSPDLACHAFDAGVDPAPLLAALRAVDARDHTRVAPGTAELLDRWRARYGVSRIETGAVLLEAVDAPSLREALALAPAIAARCRLIGPTNALVPAEDAAALAQALDARGFVV